MKIIVAEPPHLPKKARRWECGKSPLYPQILSRQTKNFTLHVCKNSYHLQRCGGPRVCGNDLDCVVASTAQLRFRWICVWICFCARLQSSVSVCIECSGIYLIDMGSGTIDADIFWGLFSGSCICDMHWFEEFIFTVLVLK